MNSYDNRPRHHGNITGPVRQLSQLVNLMARVKVCSENRTSLPLSAHVEFAINSLKTGLQHVDDHDGDEYRKSVSLSKS